MVKKTDSIATFRDFMTLDERMFEATRTVAGVPYWPLVRVMLYHGLILPERLGLSEGHPDLHGGGSSWRGRKGLSLVRGIFRGAFRRFRELVMANPRLACRRRDVLFALLPRTAVVENGRRVRQILDPFLPLVRSSCAILEYSHPSNGYLPRMKGPRVLWFGEFARVMRRFRRSDEWRRHGTAVLAEAEFVVQAVAQTLGIEVDVRTVASKISKVVSEEQALLPEFKAMLRRMGVRCVVTVVNYGLHNLVLAKAAHDLGIPVVELQHGTVYPQHCAYNLSGRDDEHLPDWLFAWGAFWAKRTHNYARRGVLPMGYPFLEAALARTKTESKVQTRLNVLFISQGTIGPRLSRLALDLQALLPADRYKVVYKLHPNESASWRRLYPWLIDSPVEVVENSSRGVYDLFGVSQFCVGVYSTALIEGLMWNLRTFAFRNLAGGDTMEGFFRAGAIVPVETVDELASGILGCGICGDSMRNGNLGEEFWMRNSARSVAAAIDEIVTTGGLYA